MKTTLKVINIGNSRGVVIPSHILEKLNITTGDLVELDIKKINGKKT
jgi:antitoxin component of MazEF toxin-antitoxin module